jgi:hypothetical protein
MVPSNPLLVEAWVGFWDVKPDGTVALKHRNTLLRIARDSAGRVSIRFGTVQQASLSFQNIIEPSHWMKTLCDPQEKSHYLFSSDGDSEVFKSKGGRDTVTMGRSSCAQDCHDPWARGLVPAFL